MKLLLYILPVERAQNRTGERWRMAATGAESREYLLNVPDMEVLTLQMLQERSKKELS